MPYRESSREESELEKDCVNVIPPSSLFIVALANYLFSHSSQPALLPKLPFHSPPHPLNSSILNHFQSPFHAVSLLSHFHQIECHSYLLLDLLQLGKQSCWVLVTSPQAAGSLWQLIYYYGDIYSSSGDSCSNDHISSSSCLNEWRHCVGLTWAVVRGFRDRSFYQTGETDCLKGACWMPTTWLSLSLALSLSHKSSSFSPPPLLVCLFRNVKEHQVSAKQEVAIVNENRLSCVFWCVFLKLNRQDWSSSQTLWQQMLAL